MFSKVVSALVFLVFAAGPAARAQGVAPVDFNRDIRPILSERCFTCHGPDANSRKADLRLDTEEGAKDWVIEAGKPDDSELYLRITHADARKVMPPPVEGQPGLNDAEKDAIRRWIAEGARWANHWAFEKPERPAVPEVRDAAWPKNPIDNFVLAKLESEGLAPSPEAPPETVLRRASFDLTGLPPTPEEYAALPATLDDAGWSAAVDRLLASPHYGERMALDWLDGARYADTNGYQNDFQRYMWPWRDWVIRTFNENMPYDQFIIEQLAGDLLPNATQSQRVATGFNRNNRATTEGGSIEEEWLVENLVDRVDTTGQVFLGLTMGCARCHDHKYDPVSQRDFYEFYAFFNMTADRGFYEETRGNVGPQEALPTYEQQIELTKRDNEIARAEERLARAEAGQATRMLSLLREYRERPAPAAPALHVPLDGSLPEGAQTTEGRAAQWGEEVLGPVLLFDGSPEAAVALGDAYTFGARDAFTIVAWVKAEGGGAILSKMDEADAARGMDFLVEAGGELTTHLIREWPESAIKVTSKDKVPLGQWSQVALRYDGSGTAAGVAFYIDGRRAAVNREVDALHGAIATREPLRLGRRSAGYSFKGALADVRIFDRPLERAEVAAQWEATLGLRVAPEPDDAARAQLAGLFERHGEARSVVRARDALAKLRNARDAYFRDNVATVMIMEELPEPRPTYVLQRGQYNLPDTSEQLTPAVLDFLGPLPDGAERNRLGMARWIASRENPLTARVMVNRLWTKFFGTGLVRTGDNFGLVGEAPSHPELLDWLAVEFIDSGWDMKALQKLIVSSAAYRQSSFVSPEMLERDPDNRLLARGPRFRLPAELVRDNALAVSGLLAPRIGGPSVMPYQPEGLWADLAGGAGQGPYVLAEGDDLYRRSLYTYRKRTVSHPTLATFDAPTWEYCRVLRGRTNTPLQALALLNDTTYVEASRALAERILREAPADPAERVAYGFRLVTGRVPTPREREILAGGVEGYHATFAGAQDEATEFLSHGARPLPEGADTAELATYTAVASVLLNLDETITKE